MFCIKWDNIVLEIGDNTMMNWRVNYESLLVENHLLYDKLHGEQIKNKRLLSDYKDLRDAVSSLESEYNHLQEDYDELKAIYDELVHVRKADWFFKLFS